MGKKIGDNILIIFGVLQSLSLGAQRSDYQFMNDVVDKVDDLINNMNGGCFTEDELKKSKRDLLTFYLLNVNNPSTNWIYDSCA